LHGVMQRTNLNAREVEVKLDQELYEDPGEEWGGEDVVILHTKEFVRLLALQETIRQVMGKGKK
jgi:hypothetical protein